MNSLKLKIYSINWYVFAFLTKLFLLPHEKLHTFKFAMCFCDPYNLSKSRDATR